MKKNTATSRVKQRNPWLLPIVVCICLAVIAYISWDKTIEKASQKRVNQEKKEWEKQVENLEKQLTTLTTGEEQQGISSDLQLLAPSPLLDMELADKKSNEPSCEQLNQKILDFFKYLDDQEYIEKRNITEGTQAFTQKLITKLTQNPPVIIDETKNLISVLQNTAHFFRVLGKADLETAREILAREAGILELTMALFYQWSKNEEKCRSDTVIIHLPLEHLYEYASFFLNTLGGQSYLFRRDSHLRLMVRYYSILILDRSNEKGMNKYGIDIRYPLKQMLAELEVSESLVYKEEYLRTLSTLNKKYATRYKPIQ